MLFSTSLMQFKLCGFFLRQATIKIMKYDGGIVFCNAILCHHVHERGFPPNQHIENWIEIDLKLSANVGSLFFPLLIELIVDREIELLWKLEHRLWNFLNASQSPIGLKCHANRFGHLNYNLIHLQNLSNSIFQETS